MQPYRKRPKNGTDGNRRPHLSDEHFRDAETRKFSAEAVGCASQLTALPKT